MAECPRDGSCRRGGCCRRQTEYKEVLVPKDQDVYTDEDIAELCLALSQDLQREAASIRRTAHSTETSAHKFRLLGRAEGLERAADIARVVGRRQAAHGLSED